MGKPAHHLILWGGALPRGGGAGLSTGFERARASRRGLLHRGGTVERQAREETHGAGGAAPSGQPPGLVRSDRRIGGIPRRGGQDPDVGGGKNGGGGGSRRDAEEEGVEVARELIKFGGEKLIQVYKGSSKMRTVVERMLRKSSESL